MQRRRLLALLIPLVVGVFAGSPIPAHDPDRRIQALDKKIAATPDDGRLYLQRGDYYRQRGDLSLALADFDRAAELEADLAVVDLGRAQVHLAMGREEPALEEIDRFLTAVPQHGAAWLTRARILNRLGRQEEAVVAYDLALQFLEPRSPQHFLERARTQAWLGRVEQAIDGLDEGIDELGPTVSLVNPAIELDIEAARYDSALQRIDQLLEIARRAAAADDLAGVHRVTVTTPSVALEMPVALPPMVAGDTFLVPRGSRWRYLDDGSNQGDAWWAPGFDDSGWATGLAELGYGDGDEATVMAFGPDPNNKHITTYFRHTFQVADARAFSGASLRLLRDDGAVVYLNGTEVGRSNMPTSAAGYRALARLPSGGPDEKLFRPMHVDSKLFRTGSNVLAVEIHQDNIASFDISFDLEFVASSAIAVERGPYLQGGTPTSVVVRWRTNAPTETVVWLGTDLNDLFVRALSRLVSTGHEAVLTGLTPGTRYFYAVGDSSGVLAGGDQGHSFTTPPPVGTARPTRIWAIGDSGTADANAAAVRDAYLNLTGDRRTDVWLMLGDNAYTLGEDSEYQAAVFDMYPTLLRNTSVWPTLGNHDALNATSNGESGVYYDIFTLPRRGEAGGLPSGTEAYYSFDHGDIHFICLDSTDTDRSPSGAMMIWLKADLANTSAQWIIAFWHHPPYSKGSHDSDREFKLVEMREIALPILEAGGVDLVLTGHSHSYERSFLLDGHYGMSSTLTAAMKLDSGDGRMPGDGAYVKPSVGRAAHEGAVYIVAGSSGKISGGPLDHPAMFISLNSLGSMVVDIDRNRLDARFIDGAGNVKDAFTLLKGVATTLTRDLPEISLSTGGAQNLFLDAGPQHAGMGYLLGGSFRTAPGFDIGPIFVPLDPDSWLQLSLLLANSAVYQNTLGRLDVQGRAQATINVPALNDPAFFGLEFYHAFIVFDAASHVLDASNAVKLSLRR